MKIGDILYTPRNLDREYFCSNSLTVFLYMGKDRATGEDSFATLFDLEDSFYEYAHDDEIEDPFDQTPWVNCLCFEFEQHLSESLHDLIRRIHAGDIYVEDDSIQVEDNVPEDLYHNLVYVLVPMSESNSLVDLRPFTNPENAFREMLAGSAFEDALRHIYNTTDGDSLPLTEFRSRFIEKLRQVFVDHTSELSKFTRLPELNPPTTSL